MRLADHFVGYAQASYPNVRPGSQQWQDLQDTFYAGALAAYSDEDREDHRPELAEYNQLVQARARAARTDQPTNWLDQ